MLAARAVLRACAVPRAAVAMPRLIPGAAVAMPRSITIGTVRTFFSRAEEKKVAPDATEGVSTSPDVPEDGSAPTGTANGGAGAANGGAGAAPAADDAALKSLRDENTKLKSQLKEVNSARLLALADMENVRRIAARDVEQARAYALQSFAKKLLDVADNLNRAVAAVPADARVKKEGNEQFAVLFEGVAATEKEMLKTLASVGIEPFGKAGEKFDPNRHEAMIQQPATDAAPEGTVTAVLKTGFVLKDRVLRAAQVAVASKM